MPINGLFSIANSATQGLSSALGGIVSELSSYFLSGDGEQTTSVSGPNHAFLSKSRLPMNHVDQAIAHGYQTPSVQETSNNEFSFIGIGLDIEEDSDVQAERDRRDVAVEAEADFSNIVGFAVIGDFTVQLYLDDAVAYSVDVLVSNNTPVLKTVGFRLDDVEADASIDLSVSHNSAGNPLFSVHYRMKSTGQNVVHCFLCEDVSAASVIAGASPSSNWERVIAPASVLEVLECNFDRSLYSSKLPSVYQTTQFICSPQRGIERNVAANATPVEAVTVVNVLKSTPQAASRWDAFRSSTSSLLAAPASSVSFPTANLEQVLGSERIALVRNFQGREFISILKSYNCPANPVNRCVLALALKDQAVVSQTITFTVSSQFADKEILSLVSAVSDTGRSRVIGVPDQTAMSGHFFAVAYDPSTLAVRLFNINMGSKVVTAIADCGGFNDKVFEACIGVDGGALCLLDSASSAVIVTFDFSSQVNLSSGLVDRCQYTKVNADIARIMHVEASSTTLLPTLSLIMQTQTDTTAPVVADQDATTESTTPTTIDTMTKVAEESATTVLPISSMSAETSQSLANTAGSTVLTSLSSTTDLSSSFATTMDSTSVLHETVATDTTIKVAEESTTTVLTISSMSAETSQSLANTAGSTVLTSLSSTTDLSSSVATTMDSTSVLHETVATDTTTKVAEASTTTVLPISSMSAETSRSLANTAGSTALTSLSSTTDLNSSVATTMDSTSVLHGTGAITQTTATQFPDQIINEGVMPKTAYSTSSNAEGLTPAQLAGVIISALAFLVGVVVGIAALCKGVIVPILKKRRVVTTMDDVEGGIEMAVISPAEPKVSQDDAEKGWESGMLVATISQAVGKVESQRIHSVALESSSGSRHCCCPVFVFNNTTTINNVLHVAAAPEAEARESLVNEEKFVTREISTELNQMLVQRINASCLETPPNSGKSGAAL